jgi:hypothetical protein
MKNTVIASVLSTFALMTAPAIAGNSLLLETATEQVALKVAREVAEGGVYQHLSSTRWHVCLDRCGLPLQNIHKVAVSLYPLYLG